MTLPLSWLMVFLCQGPWSSLGHSQSQGPPEVVIPLKITDSDSSLRTSNWISYSLKFEGQRHVVHLKLIKYLMARNMPLFTYTDQGALLEDYPFIQDNCYYHGYMDGDPKSQVSLNHCFGGFQGFLQKGNAVYQIEPKINSTSFEHLVYKLISEEKEMPARRCGLADADPECQFKKTKVDHLPTARQSGISGWWTHKRYYKLGIVVNYDLYKDYQSNGETVENQVMLIISVLYGYYQQLDLHVVVMGIEIWTDKNQVNFVDDTQYLRVYCDWMERSFSLRIVHNSGVLVCKLPKDSLYNVYAEIACIPSFKCGFVQHRKSYNAVNTAVILAQLLGIQIGLTIDTPPCTCGQTHCIMSQGKNMAHLFSNCSYAEYYAANTQCLFDVPKELRSQRCGNGVVDEGEACDCGSASNCAQDPCCETDCSLAPGAQCASGLCCRSCKFLPTGTECRKSANECDLPEWCNGTSAQCPDDVYVQGGVPCGGGGGHCYAKRCNSREEQCRGLFGKQARSARPSCYRDANVRGDRFGNCGLDFASYTACAVRDALCGRLQCEDVPRLPALQNHTTLVATNISGTVCWGLDFHWGAGQAASGEVRDGTECGHQKICVQRRCVPLSYFTSRCSPEHCARRGTCNNRHHCHCRPPWRPPFCYVAGVGGSVDSGPPPGSAFAEPDQEEALGFQPSEVTHTHLCFYLLLLRFLVFLLIFLAVLLRAVV